MSLRHALLGMLAGFAVLMVAGGLRARSTYHRLGLNQCTSFTGDRWARDHPPLCVRHDLR